MSCSPLLRRCGRAPDQAGFGLTEVLVAVMLMGIVVAGILGTTLTTLQAGAQARAIARLNTLTTSFGEALKGLPYRECASSVEYRNAFASADASAKQPHLTDSPGATFTVLSVTGGVSNGSSCPDEGTQTVRFEVSVAGRSQQASILKRSPQSPLSAIRIDFTWTIRLAGAPDLLVELVPIVRRGSDLVDTTGYTFDWWCMPAWDSDPPTVTPPPEDDVAQQVHYQRIYQDPDNQSVGLAECRHAAPKENSDDPTSMGVILLVTDNLGIVHPIVPHLVPLPTTTVHLDPPGASIRVRNSPPAPGCTDVPGDGCTRDLPVELDGGFSTPGAGTFVLCSWTFSDGWSPQVFRGSDCNLQPVIRTYSAPTTVTLVVTNSYGRTSTTTRLISVPAGLSPPTVQLVAKFAPSYLAQYSATSGTSADTLRSYAPERIQFDAVFAPGNADAGGVITKYVLDFGDGTAPQVVGSVDPSAPPLTSFAPASHRFLNSTSGLNACRSGPGAAATLTITERVWDDIGDQWVNLTMVASVCIRLESLENQIGPDGYHNVVNHYFNAGTIGTSRVWLGFTWDSILGDPSYPADGFIIEQRYSDATYLNSCAIKSSSRVDFPRDGYPLQPGGKRRVRPSITSDWLGDAYNFIISQGGGCRHQARLIRVTKDVDPGPNWMQCPDPPEKATQLKNQIGGTLIQCSEWSPQDAGTFPAANWQEGEE